MAEAVGMAIAAVITSQLGIRTMSFPADSQALAVFFFDGPEHQALTPTSS